jgi:hypothetical protein
MKAFTRVNILDLNNPGAPPAHRVNGMNAEPAVANEPRRDSLGHTDATYFTFGALAPEMACFLLPKQSPYMTIW